MPNFFDKEKYVFNCESLQLYFRLGLKLNKIHRVLEFNRSQWLKPYVEFNKNGNKSRQKRKSIIQINEQCCIWQNKEKFEK